MHLGGTQSGNKVSIPCNLEALTLLQMLLMQISDSNNRFQKLFTRYLQHNKVTAFTHKQEPSQIHKHSFWPFNP